MISKIKQGRIYPLKNGWKMQVYKKFNNYFIHGAVISPEDQVMLGVGPNEWHIATWDGDGHCWFVDTLISELKQDREYGKLDIDLNRIGKNDYNNAR